MSKQFNHLNIPSHWQNYWTRFPEGHTILEALIQWVSQVDEMVDNQNKLSDTVSNYGTRLDQFIDQFEGNLSEKVIDTLGEWQQSGFLDIVIDQALETKFHEMDDRLTTQLAQKATLFNETVLVTVGENGDYSTINEALENITKQQPFYTQRGARVQIDLLSGFEMNEQVLVNGLNLNWVIITSQDEVVPARRSALTEYIGCYPLFGVTHGVLPSIRVQFEMDDTGLATERVGIYLRENSSGQVDRGGVRNTGGDGLLVEFNSSCEIRDIDFDGAGGDGISARHTSVIQGRHTLETNNISARNAGGVGLYATQNSSIHARHIDVTGAGGFGVRAEDSSRIEARGLKADDCGGTGISAERNSDINARSPEARLVSVQGCSSNAIYCKDNSRITLSEEANLSTSGSHGVVCISAAVIIPKAIIEDSGGRGVSVQDGGKVIAVESNISNATTDGLYCVHGSEFVGRNSSIKNSGDTNVRVASSRVYIDNSDCSDYGGSNAIRGLDGSFINATNVTCQNGGVNGSQDIRGDKGTTINAVGVTGGIYRTPNEVTLNGVIYN